MPMADKLEVGQMVTYNGMAIKLTQYVDDIAGRYYWWAETLFTEIPEKTMMAFSHGAAIKGLHSNEHHTTAMPRS